MNDPVAVSEKPLRRRVPCIYYGDPFACALQQGQRVGSNLGPIELRQTLGSLVGTTLVCFGVMHISSAARACFWGGFETQMGVVGVGVVMIVSSIVALVRSRHKNRVAMRLANVGGLALSFYAILGLSQSIMAVPLHSADLAILAFSAVNVLMFVLGATIAIPFSLLFEQPKEEERKLKIKVLGCGKRH